MTVVNAFDWQEYTNQEHAKHGDPFKDIKRNAVISANVTEGIHKIREKKPSHGTIFGITEKRISFVAPKMMGGSGGARPGAGRKLPEIDKARAMKLLNDGLTKKEIAARLDVPYKSMLTFFKKIGEQKSRGSYEWSGKYKNANV